MPVSMFCAQRMMFVMMFRDGGVREIRRVAGRSLVPKAVTVLLWPRRPPYPMPTKQCEADVLTIPAHALICVRLCSLDPGHGLRLVEWRHETVQPQAAAVVRKAVQGMRTEV